ncbi:MAG: hypothetical protein HY710_05815, partial [Candidatus Latescibacteria bacterium]|nr:hypothetical protein [Candidatus Latescibacterota bacterium]
MFRNVLLLTVAFSLSYMNVWAEMLEGDTYSHNDLIIQTADKVTVRGSLFDRDHEKVIIYCHRLLGSQSEEEVQQLLEAFIDEYDLITFNFRGHQSSAWMSTMGGDEVLDLRAVISFAVKKGYGKIVVLGAGMGGSVAIRTAGIFRNIDALIVVSPSGFSVELQPFLVRMGSDIMLDTEFGRVSLRMLTNTRLGTRYTAGYPIDIIDTVSPIPLAVVQSENDRFVKLNKIRDAFDRALEPKKFILVPGSLHADKLLVKSTLSEIRHWLNGVFPEEKSKESSSLEGSPVTDHPDSIRIVLTGDLPIPEEVIVGDFYERLYGPARTSYKTKMNAESIVDNLKNVFSFYGYTVVSLTLSDSVPFFNIRVSIPHIHSVSIEGNQWVTDDDIRHFLTIDGDYYNAYELDRAIRRVSSQPSIQTVTVGSTMREDGTVDLHVNVVEKRPYRLLLAAKFTDLGQFYGTGFTWNEFNPSGVQLAGQAMVGVGDRNVYTSLGATGSVWGHHMRLGGKYFDVIKSRDDLDYIYTRQEVHERGGEVTASYRVTSTITANLGVFGKEYKSPEARSDFLVQEGT